MGDVSTPQKDLMIPTTSARRLSEPSAESARAYLELTRLLNAVERDHPEISAPLRLTLIRAHREHQISWLDADRFRAVVDDLLAHGARPIAS